ncbi:MAG: hypothetical protein MUE85_06205 [Microscillaceae bacterium]|nr:hypothetical protein [Microscillaceae bacterium]
MEGNIGNLLEKASQKCKVVDQALKAKITQSQDVGSDETGAKVNGQNRGFGYVKRSTML